VLGEFAWHHIENLEKLEWLTNNCLSLSGFEVAKQTCLRRQGSGGLLAMVDNLENTSLAQIDSFKSKLLVQLWSWSIFYRSANGEVGIFDQFFARSGVPRLSASLVSLNISITGLRLRPFQDQRKANFSNLITCKNRSFYQKH